MQQPEPVTEQWLRSSGFDIDDEGDATVAIRGPDSDGCEQTRLTIMRTDDGEWLLIQDDFLFTLPIEDVVWEVQRLCEVFRIDLKD